MTNELKIFESAYDIGISKVQNEISEFGVYAGIVYLLEWGNLGVKIGQSRRPAQRIKEWEHYARYGGFKFGRIAITPIHTNYITNEGILHVYFDKYRVSGTELFAIPFDDVLAKLPVLNYEEIPLTSASVAKKYGIEDEDIDLTTTREELIEDYIEFTHNHHIDYSVLSMLNDPYLWIPQLIKAQEYYTRQANAAQTMIDVLTNLADGYYIDDEDE